MSVPMTRRGFIAATAASVACAATGTESEATSESTHNTTGTSTTGTSATATSTTAATSATTTSAGLDLVYLREEEKLARDVYLTLYDRWGTAVFLSISESEQRHMEQVLTLLETRNIPDPVIDDTVGVFQNPSLAALYLDLIALGETSELDAFLVGCTIEDMDIYDIDGILAGNQDADVQAALGSLMCGSRNHMRSFQDQLAVVGGVYEAQFLDPTEIEGIVASAREQCGGGGGGGGQPLQRENLRQILGDRGAFRMTGAMSRLP